MGRIFLGFAVFACLAVTAPAKAATLDYSANPSNLTFISRTVAYPFVASAFNIKETYRATYARQSTLVDLVPLWEPGRLNSISFTSDAFLSGTFRSYFDAIPELFDDGTFNEPWRAYGGHTVSGSLSLLANGSLLGSTTFSFFVLNSCSGVAAGSCEIDIGNEFTGMLPDIADRNLGTYYGSDIPIVEMVFDDLEIVGKFNDDRGKFAGGEYASEWTFRDSILVSYDYTPLSEVPLPAAFWLLLSALSVLGLVARGRQKR